MRLLRGFCSTSASPSSLSRGGTYIANRPRNPFFNPYQPPTGLFGERAQASTVPSAAGFCSSALPSSIQPPSFLSMVQAVDTAQVVTQFLLLRRDDQIPTAHSSFAFACQTAGGKGRREVRLGAVADAPRKLVERLECRVPKLHRGWHALS
jgi:hypothetical protein